MNIDSLMYKINLFEELVVSSGFQRNMHDYYRSIGRSQDSSIVRMQEFAQKILDEFNIFRKNSLDSELQLLLRDTDAFTSKGFASELQELNDDHEIESEEYFRKFHNILQRLSEAIEANVEEISEIKEIFEKYVSEQYDLKSDKKQALFSLVFRDKKTVSTFKEFSRVLSVWNITLRNIHTLLTSESPEDISIVQIQNGSIDIIFNFNFDLVIDVKELILCGYIAWSHYLNKKSQNHNKLDAEASKYSKSEQIVKKENELEELYLENIKCAIKAKANELHTERLKSDEEISKESVDVKINDIASTISDHIIKGNDIKLLAPPPDDTEENGKESDKVKASRELRIATSAVREQITVLSDDDKNKLIKYFSKKDSDKNGKNKKEE